MPAIEIAIELTNTPPTEPGEYIGQVPDCPPKVYQVTRTDGVLLAYVNDGNFRFHESEFGELFWSAPLSLTTKENADDR